MLVLKRKIRTAAAMQQLEEEEKDPNLLHNQRLTMKMLADLGLFSV